MEAAVALTVRAAPPPPGPTAEHLYLRTLPCLIAVQEIDITEISAPASAWAAKQGDKMLTHQITAIWHICKLSSTVAAAEASLRCIRTEKMRSATFAQIHTAKLKDMRLATGIRFPPLGMDRNRVRNTVRNMARNRFRNRANQ